MVTLAVVSSTAAFGKESITQLGKDIKEIKGMVMANWEPDDATIVSPPTVPEEVNDNRTLCLAFYRRLCSEGCDWKHIWVRRNLQSKSHGADVSIVMSLRHLTTQITRLVSKGNLATLDWRLIRQTILNCWKLKRLSKIRLTVRNHSLSRMYVYSPVRLCQDKLFFSR